MNDDSQPGRRRLGHVLRGVAAGASGLLLFSAFPPLCGAEAAWVALVPLLLVARHSTGREAFKCGFAGGAIFWLLAMSWMLRLSASGGPLPLVVLGWVSLCAYCALYIGAFCYLVSALWSVCGEQSAPAKESSPWRGAAGHARNLVLIAVIPVVWVGLEYLRSVLFTGFPWNALGISQFRNLAIIQVAAVGGVHAVSGVLVLMNVALAMTVERFVGVYVQRRPVRLHTELMAGLLVCALCWVHGVRAVRRADAEATFDPAIVVAAIQPNIAQTRKWTEEAVDEIYHSLHDQTDLALTFADGLDLIVWPETAVPGAVNVDPQSLAFVQAMARRGVPLLVGSMEVSGAAADLLRAADGVVPAGDGPGGAGEEELYNSSFLFDSDGREVSRYRKRHLVLFGEAIPFGEHIPFLRRVAPLGFVCTPGEEATVFSLGKKGTRFSTLICFEDVFPGLARTAVAAGARLLVNQTNDAWFDGWLLPGWGAVQHASHSVLRCVENRVPGVRCANSGVTCFIDRVGRIQDAGELSGRDWDMRVAGYKISGVRVPADDAAPTFYTRHGDVVLGLPCAVVTCVLFLCTCVLPRRMRDAGEQPETRN